MFIRSVNQINSLYPTHFVGTHASTQNSPVSIEQKHTMRLTKVPEPHKVNGVASKLPNYRGQKGLKETCNRHCHHAKSSPVTAANTEVDIVSTPKVR